MRLSAWAKKPPSSPRWPIIRPRTAWCWRCSPDRCPAWWQAYPEAVEAERAEFATLRAAVSSP
ncbi:hypothetical protein [Nonomuraea sp. NEAU-A123]|uniref:hypothetical protein n=1 Tax=Nonomuraea sp. NEAU-A123 TaxID=2839649 RepID=UPI001BE3EEF9|nr:hypothetical protein [Nonomuraea sp. NEAU-A123]MBT2233460.1 hypothetical protein [Nonomuraea sp. NEAU-A123]